MNRYFIIFAYAILLATTAFSQSTINGKVIDATTNRFIAGASVFISNTSKGTTSNAVGEFVLSDIPAGTHDLVISNVGYNTYVKSFTTADLPLSVNVKLSVKIKELEGVTLVPFEKDGWAKWGKVFLDNFIGSTPNGINCKIVNYKTIKFRFYKKEDKLTAIATEPLVIQNRALGYTIHYQLEGFEVDYSNGSMSYYGYPLFEEKKADKKRWKLARQKSYLGSVNHFIRSVYNNKTNEDGFEIKRLKKVPNTEKQRVKSFYKVVKKKERDPKTGQVFEIMDYNNELFAPDSVAYYQKVLSQKDYFDVYSDYFLNADSVVVYDSLNNKYLYFPDYLAITYKNALEDKKYLQSILEANRKPFYQRSSLILTGNGYVSIEKNGSYFSPQDLYTNGYWGWHEKIAELLPVDYDPGEP